MFEKSLHVVMAICLSLSIALAESPKNHGDGDPFESDAYIFLSGAVPYLSAIAYAPSSPDNWLGGTGNWSNTSFWSSGLPGQSSDVMINTGNDYVTLNTSASINSLTLGGNSGSSTLIDPTGGDYAVNIAGALTINQSGALSLSTGDVVTADANSKNGGSIILNDGAQLQINANFSNLQGMQMDNGTALNVTGTFDNSGSIQYL